MSPGSRPAEAQGPHLVVISDTPYYTRGDETVGWGPVVRELDHLTRRFARITNVAPVYSGAAPASSLAHRSDRVTLVPVHPAGGAGVAAKAGILARYPGYGRTMRRAMTDADAVHIRCPSNVALLALAVYATTRRAPPAWIKFAGNWHPDGPEFWSYRVQREWLRRGIGGATVTVNGRWAAEPGHVVPFRNPTLDDLELARGAAAAAGKDLVPPYRMAFAGRLDRAKGAARSLEIAIAAAERGLPVELDVVGDGPQGPAMRHRAAERGLGDAVHFHGWLPRPDVEALYARAHFLLLPSESEGFPKVVAEAMAFGAVPLAGAVSDIPATLADIGTGVVRPPTDITGFVEAVADFVDRPDEWRRQRDRGVAGASRFSYDRFLEDVEALFRDRLDLPLGSPGS